MGWENVKEENDIARERAVRKETEKRKKDEDELAWGGWLP